jgi:hypothetical protein
MRRPGARQAEVSILFGLRGLLILDFQEKADFLQNIDLILEIEFFEEVYQLGKAIIRMLLEHLSLTGFEPAFIHIERRTNQLNESVVNFSLLYFNSRQIPA